MSVIESHRNQQPRLTFFYYVLLGMVLVLVGGLAYRQIFRNQAYSESERLQNRRRILIPGPRGNIYDREGRALVVNRPRFAAVVYLSDHTIRKQFREQYIKLVRNAREKGTPMAGAHLDIEARTDTIQKYLDQINKILGRHDKVDPQELQRHFTQVPLLPFPLVRNLSPDEFAKIIEQVPIKSPIQIYSTNTRYYPYGSAAAHVLGYVVSSLDVPDEGLPGANLTTFTNKGTYGRTGLEHEFDSRLQGKTGTEIWIVDPSGYQVRMVKNEPAVHGQDLQTSLDIDLELTADKAFGDKEGALVALKVKTGEVLAMVSKPDYNLNDFTPYISTETWKKVTEEGALPNKAIQGLYPPGSTFKIVTATAALKAGAVNANTEIDCTGYLKVGSRMFPCDDRSGHGVLKLPEAIQESCNVFFYTIGLKTGIENIAAQADQYGLNKPTGIQLPYETSAMIIPTREWKEKNVNMPWFPGDTANTSIGQGFVRVTPLQMACLVASFARGQTRTRPTILKSNVDDIPVNPGNHPIGLSPDQYKLILHGMERVVQLGTGRLVRIPGIPIAGKTGTAQVRTPKGTLEMAWFVCFAPADNPQIAVASVVRGKPGYNNAGGLYSAPIVKKVLLEYFKKHPLPKPQTVANNN